MKHPTTVIFGKRRVTHETSLSIPEFSKPVREAVAAAVAGIGLCRVHSVVLPSDHDSDAYAVS